MHLQAPQLFKALSAVHFLAVKKGSCFRRSLLSPTFWL